MTTKQKIIASIWVPIVSMYILNVLAFYLQSGLRSSNFLDHLLGVFYLFLFGSIFWLPALIVCLILENTQIKNEINDKTIIKIFKIEALICSIPIWLMMVTLLEALGLLILFNLMVILSIAARWGYLKLRKIC